METIIYVDRSEKTKIRSTKTKYNINCNHITNLQYINWNSW